jgi:hypothetical protein
VLVYYCVAPAMIVRIQSWIRMLMQRYKYLEWKNKKNNYVKSYLKAWFLYMKTEKMYRVSAINYRFHILRYVYNQIINVFSIRYLTF